MSLRVSASPHIYASDTSQNIMRDVVIALIPTALAGIYFFGTNAIIILAVSTISAVLAEYVWQKALHKPVTINDYSAVITGLLLGLNLPSTAPWWMAMVGSVLAIILVKQMFGGLGDNFMNPALAARGILLASWPVRMTTFAEPTGFAAVTDAVSSPTVLAGYKATTMDMFLGNIPGSVGEVCKAALLLGFVYLLVRRVISWRIPVVLLGTIAVCAWAFGPRGDFSFTGNPLQAILSGGIMLGAIFMATDYTTAPMTPKGQIVYALGCGLLVALIRTYGSYPEGATYGILVMNIVTPLINKYMRNKPYGYVKPVKAPKEVA